MGENYRKAKNHVKIVDKIIRKIFKQQATSLSYPCFKQIAIHKHTPSMSIDELFFISVLGMLKKRNCTFIYSISN